MTSHQPSQSTYFNRRTCLWFFLLLVCGLACWLIFVAIHGKVPGSPQILLIPEGSAMASCPPEMPRLLLNPCEEGGITFIPGYYTGRNAGASIEGYQGLEPKIGGEALKCTTIAPSNGGNGRAIFLLSRSPPGLLPYLGAWIYLAPDSNMLEVSFIVEDDKENTYEAVIPADWKGWKWIEFNLQNSTFKPLLIKRGRESGIIFPLKNVYLACKTRGPVTAFLGIDGVAAVEEPNPGNKPYTVQINDAGNGEANTPFNGEAVVNNFSDKPVEVDIDYSIQPNPLFHSVPLPDPVYGSNRALDCKTWIEVDGKRIEDATLTDNERESYFNTSDFAPGGGTEGFQFLDLGKERTITRMDYYGGEAKWLHKVDFAASLDGQKYEPVEGLQEINVANEWGGPNRIPVLKPFAARYLRLRYHNDGNKLNGNDPDIKDSIAFYTFSELHVYDSIHPEELEIPKIGAMIEQKTVHITAPPRNFVLMPLPTSVPLKTGCYYFEAVVKGPSGPQFYSDDYFARSVTEVAIRPESRFGINSAGANYAQLLKRLGVGWVRFENMKWIFYNPAPGDFRFDGTVKPWEAPIDDWMSQYRAAGFSILPFIYMTPDWASSAPPESARTAAYPPRDNDDYGKAIFELAARYGSAPHPDGDLHTSDKKSGLNWITTYEIWNEPNLTDPNWGTFVGPLEKYLDLFRVGAEAVKHADPNSKVTTGGFSGFPMEMVDKIRTYKYPDGKSPLDFTDIFNVHFYSGTQEPEWATSNPTLNRNGTHSNDVVTYEKKLMELSDWRDRFKPSMQIWLTETGYDVSGPIGRPERFQAAKIPRNLMICLANGVEKVFLYRETGSSPLLHFGSGIIRDDTTLTLRPSYFTLATLIRELDSVTDLRTPRLQTSNPQVWLYYWKRSKDRLLTAWTPRGTEPLGLDLGKCHVTDAFGMESDVDVNQDFPLSIFPVYITKIANSVPVEQLEKEAVVRENQRQKTWAFLMDKAHIYLYDFGSHQNAAFKTFGLARPVIPVEADDVYDAKNGYGFLGKGGKNEWDPGQGRPLMESGWISFPGPDGFQFQIDAVPGVYNLELKVFQPDKNTQLTIDGAKEGPISVPLENNNLTKAQITIVAGQPLQLKIPENIKVQWVTLVEIPPQAP